MIMRGNNRSNEGQKIIQSIINGAKICRIALCDGGKAYIIPMSFGYDGKRIYLHSSEKGKKVELMRKSTSICFELESHVEIRESSVPCRFGMDYKSVVGYGKLVFLSSIREKKEALLTIMEHYTGKREFEFNEEVMRRTLVIAIDIEEMTYRISEKTLLQPEN